ncbi:MAG: hypothetical protein MJZ32_06925 [Bacteroidaceae bacterium]|nr:hypothetical protein [Bacteroidaceae bacterium]
MQVTEISEKNTEALLRSHIQFLSNAYFIFSGSKQHMLGETWQIADCYPFASKDSHKKTSSKAFVMANIYSQVVMDNIQAAINQCNEVYALTQIGR